MAALADNFRLVFWLALIPGLISVAILVLSVREPKSSVPGEQVRAPIRLTDVRQFAAAFWGVVVVGALLTLARFSEAFLILRAQGMGLPLALAPVVLVIMNVVYSATAYPAGILSDRIERRAMLAVGFAALIAADLILAFAPGISAAVMGVGLWGLHMGMTQGLLAALVADTTPAPLRGTGFGFSIW